MSPLAVQGHNPSAQFVEMPNVLGEPLFLQSDGLIKKLKRALRPYDVQISEAPEGVQVDGDDVGVMLTTRILERLAELQDKSREPNESLLEDVIFSVIEHALGRDLVFRLEGLLYPVRPMSLGQVAFMRALLSNEEELILGIGPTGTGKTHLSLAAGLSLLAQARVKQIVVTRSQGFLNGEIVTRDVRQESMCEDQFEAIGDILTDLIGAEKLRPLIDQHKLLFVPLAHIRGRTFNHSFIIVDEAENMSVGKMRMVTTRIGQGSRMAVIGDPAQIDLPSDVPSGLTHFLDLIRGTDIAVVHPFETDQIIRNDIVARIEELYSNESDSDEMAEG